MAWNICFNRLSESIIQRRLSTDKIAFIYSMSKFGLYLPQIDSNGKLLQINFFTKLLKFPWGGGGGLLCGYFLKLPNVNIDKFDNLGSWSLSENFWTGQSKLKLKPPVLINWHPWSTLSAIIQNNPENIFGTNVNTLWQHTLIGWKHVLTPTL